MNSNILLLVTVTTLVALPSVASAYGCLSALKPSARAFPALPLACRQMGPLRLGMSYMQLVKEIGNADGRSPINAGYYTLKYLFPRNLIERVRRHAVTEHALLVGVGILSVRIYHGHVVALGEWAPSSRAHVPFGVGGLAIGQSLTSVKRTTKVRYAFYNDPSVLYGEMHFDPNYPIRIGFNKKTGRINGIEIMTNLAPDTGVTSAAVWEFNFTASGLVDGFKVW